eukprot:TRINITY_DN731_c0_g1_i1.p1 TRINITY_DN731_c0_g1~~TRINITY_DN731_c0_g1_i1.p1  ORF type:complete len:418 (+),score=93.71 TRINITY_DN731_c0_g1_i1:489-1742(+)
MKLSRSGISIPNSPGSMRANNGDDPMVGTPEGMISTHKVFVGGLSWDTTNDGLRNYFSKFGEVVEAVIMRDRASGRSRGFGFITFTDEAVADQVSLETHVLDGRVIEAKKAVPREEMAIRGLKTKKVFVGGLPMSIGEDEFREYFERFGSVTDAQIMLERDTGRPRGFGFVTFENEDSVEKVLSVNHELSGKIVEVKKAEPKRSFSQPTAERPQASSLNAGYGPGGNGPALNLRASSGGTGNSSNSGFFSPYLTSPLSYGMDRGLFGSEGGGGGFPGFPGYYGGLGLGLGLGLNGGMDDPLAFYGTGSGGAGAGGAFGGLGLGNIGPIGSGKSSGVIGGGSGSANSAANSGYSGYYSSNSIAEGIAGLDSPPHHLSSAASASAREQLELNSLNAAFRDPYRPPVGRNDQRSFHPYRV